MDDRGWLILKIDFWPSFFKQPAPTFTKPRYTTFNKVYQLRWKDVLRFRDRSMFSQCEICQLLKQDLANKALSFEQKLGAVQMYRAHLHDQFCDRSVCWQIQAESADPSTDVLCICTDGLDQAKFALPRDPGLRTSSALTLVDARLKQFPNF